MSTTLSGGNSPASSGVTAKPVALVENKRSRNNKNSGVGSTLEIVHRTIDPANTSVFNATILNNDLTNCNATTCAEVFELPNPASAPDTLLDMNVGENPAFDNTSSADRATACG